MIPEVLRRLEMHNHAYAWAPGLPTQAVTAIEPLNWSFEKTRQSSPIKPPTTHARVAAFEDPRIFQTRRYWFHAKKFPYLFQCLIRLQCQLLIPQQQHLPRMEILIQYIQLTCVIAACAIAMSAQWRIR